MVNKNINKLNKKSTIAVIGSGFAGLTSSAMLGAAGADVTVFEKNMDIGGRARNITMDGFVFDMGPSWYWMPDVYEKYYNVFGHTTSDFYELKKLDPGFRVVFGKDDYIDVPENFERLCTLFESIEKGSAVQLQKFMKQAAYKYSVGMNNMVYLPGHSVSEYLSLGLIRDAFKLQLFSSFSKHIRSFFKNPRLIALMEFPVLFLGAMPKDTPALYSLMNYAGLKQGTFYPLGGFGKVVDAFQKIAEEVGVSIKTNERVERLEINSGAIKNIHSNGASTAVDAVIATADYHHVENSLLPPAYRSYDKAYWNKKVFAPSCLIFYLGVNKKLEKLIHHNLFFDEDLNQHAIEIYESQKWPSNPLFYVCCPSKTDATVAPVGCENLFVLMPIAAGLVDTEEIRTHYYHIILDRLEKFAGEEIRGHVTTKKTYSVSDFKTDYNAYKGNAYGLANTLLQTAIFKPKLKSRKVNNLFFAGQLTVPGPGVPPSIISGQIAANELLKSTTLQQQN